MVEKGNKKSIKSKIDIEKKKNVYISFFHVANFATGKCNRITKFQNL